MGCAWLVKFPGLTGGRNFRTCRNNFTHLCSYLLSISVISPNHWPYKNTFKFQHLAELIPIEISEFFKDFSLREGRLPDIMNLRGQRASDYFDGQTRTGFRSLFCRRKGNLNTGNEVKGLSHSIYGGIIKLSLKIFKYFKCL